MNQIELRALAKINLGLDVLGRRENGYHDVRMIMQSIYLYDEVKIIKRKEPGIRLATNLGFLPVGEGNIAYKAAQMLTEEFQLDQGLRSCWTSISRWRQGLPAAARMQRQFFSA